MIYLILVSLLIIINLFLIKPNNNSRKSQMAYFEKVYLTHRGFFNNVDIPENSIAAFKKTVRNKMGTELDVQLTKDGKLVVFHDHNLQRVCGVDKILTECTYQELQEYNLLNTNEKIPLFEDVLEVLKPNTPLIIEIKPEGDCIKTADITAKLMKEKYNDYTFVMESFNPYVVKFLKENHPDIIRGQLAYNLLKDKDNKQSFIIKFILTNLLMNFITKPDFIAYHVHSRYNLSFLICSRIFKCECVSWTVKNEDDLRYARKYSQQIIFDSFTPSDITVCD